MSFEFRDSGVDQKDKSSLDSSSLRTSAGWDFPSRPSDGVGLDAFIGTNLIFHNCIQMANELMFCEREI
ncbi:hypothetical protein AGR1A_pAt20402 [Agrobacterium fabacearum CFBP 5771]|nr:hypothetical protein AGR1A_pAt20402 [Agrobacterium fabacearum CFBP 5771]